MPDLGGQKPITPEINRWLGQVAHLVKATGNTADLIGLTVASDGLNSVLRDQNAQRIAAIVYRALAYAEANSPAAARGAFVGIGAAFDAMKAIREVLSEAKQNVLIVDAYMDAKVLTDFAPLASEGVAIRLLSDSFSTKADALLPAAERWAQQFGSARPLEIRLSTPRALHDRLIVADDRAVVWSLTQSLKDFAGRSPALVQRVDKELAEMKADFYAQTWSAATPIFQTE
jgi:hypothetical protein